MHLISIMQDLGFQHTRYQINTSNVFKFMVIGNWFEIKFVLFNTTFLTFIRMYIYVCVSFNRIIRPMELDVTYRLPSITLNCQILQIIVVQLFYQLI